MKRSKEIFIQLIIGISFALIIGVFINNLALNIHRSGMGFSFKWLIQPAGFALAESSIPYKPSDSYAWVLLVGWVNSLKVIIYSLILATLIGTIAGISRMSSNILLRQISSFYVAIVRQIPLLLQLMFWYFVAFLNLSSTPFELINSLIVVSKQGINILGLDLTIEFSALIFGLSVFSGASIAEVIRGGMNSVGKGQWEAFRSLGINDSLGIRKIVIPQALPAMIPGITSQYLNLAKNSTLAIAIGYSDIYAVSDTTITQTGRAIEGFLVLLVSFLLLNLFITSTMETINRIITKYDYN